MFQTFIKSNHHDIQTYIDSEACRKCVAAPVFSKIVDIGKLNYAGEEIELAIRKFVLSPENGLSIPETMRYSVNFQCALSNFVIQKFRESLGESDSLIILYINIC